MATVRSDDRFLAGSATAQLARRSRGLPQRRFALAGLVIVAAIAYLIIASFSSAVSSVFSTGQLLSRGSAIYGQTVRLQGKVIGATRTDSATLDHLFRVSDGHTALLVKYGSDLPGGFKTGASVEAQGSYNGSVFTATTLTAKCPTKYQAASTSG
jgi:cytochrome c-type biogenesis protein CcmE